jgi:predicted acetyltransferase
MTLELRSVDRSDAEAFVRCAFLTFGVVPVEDSLSRAVERFEPDFALGVFDHGRIVATASAKPMELTLPAGAGAACPTLPVPGVTAVCVLPTHRRQGLLTAMMQHQLADLRQRGYPLSVLLASESIIYGRFGYGPAQYSQALAVERAHSAFRPDAAVHAATGRIRFIDPDEAAKVLPLVHDRARRQRPGELNRTASWWRGHLLDLEPDRKGGEARIYALHESSAGEADGWVSYRYHDQWDIGDLPRSRVEVNDVVATAPGVRAALWHLVLNLDLVGEVQAREQPADEPLKWLLADPRRARTTGLVDHLWVRLLDIPAALAARGYGAAERLVIEVTAPDPAAGGRFLLEPGPSSGSCRTAKEGEKAQLVLGLADLGAIYLGGVAPSVLAGAGRITELQPGALVVADRVFASPVAPFCSRHF